ncbi:hypothetical protein [Brevibacillus dissolubilis]|uniref:hypothetical protein n=1 Tax=Brevibacillus dissolubilis TaxID=1844116 RepID=UPI001116CF5E|nr:hypothetical protein [Brevibacillus dissolubilis]
MRTNFNTNMEVDILAKLADLRDADYQNTIVLHALIELLIQKGLFTRQELVAKANQLDATLENQIHPATAPAVDGNPPTPGHHPIPDSRPATLPDHQTPTVPDSISASTTTPPAW